MENKLYIGGIPQDTDEMALAQLVGAYGDILTIKIVRDKASGKAKGFAFVEMKTERGAVDAAAALHELAFRGRTLEVKLADAPKPQPAPARYERVRRPGEPQRTMRPRRKRL